MVRWHAFCMLHCVRAHDLLAVVCACWLCGCVCVCSDGLCEGVCVGGVHGVRRLRRTAVVVRGEQAAHSHWWTLVACVRVVLKWKDAPRWADTN